MTTRIDLVHDVQEGQRVGRHDRRRPTCERLFSLDDLREDARLHLRVVDHARRVEDGLAPDAAGVAALGGVGRRADWVRHRSD